MTFDRLHIVFAGIWCVVMIFIIGCESDEEHLALQQHTDEAATTNAVTADEIAVSNVVWLDTDVSQWEITSDLSVSLSGRFITYDHDGSSKWPATYVDGGYVSANPWIFISKGGVWYGSTDEWMRPNQTVKEKSHVNGAHMKKYNYFSSSWVPTPGVQYGFMVSGLARTGHRNAMERTQIILMTWE